MLFEKEYRPFKYFYFAILELPNVKCFQIDSQMGPLAVVNLSPSWQVLASNTMVMGQYEMGWRWGCHCYGLDLKCPPSVSCVWEVTGSRSSVLIIHGEFMADFLLESKVWLEEVDHLGVTQKASSLPLAPFFSPCFLAAMM